MDGADAFVGGAVTSVRTVPSNATWRALRHRGIEAVATDKIRDFEEDGAAVELLDRCFQLGGIRETTQRRRRTRNRSADLGDLVRHAVARAMDATHEDEEHFSRELFEAVAELFRSPAAGGWRVHRNPLDKRRRVVVQPARRRRLQRGQEAPAKDETIVYRFDDMILLGRFVEEDAKSSKDGGTATKPKPRAPSAAFAAAASVAVATARAAPHSPPPLGRPGRKVVDGPCSAGDLASDDEDRKPSPLPSPLAAAAPPPPPGRVLRKRKRARDFSAGAATQKPPMARATSSTGARIGPRTNTLVRRVGDTLYAVGFSRKVRMHDPDKGLSIIEGESFPDHACIMYKKNIGTRGGRQYDDADDDDGANVNVNVNVRVDADADVDDYDDYDDSYLEGGDDWIVHRLLVSVELKTDETSGKLFEVTRIHSKRKRGVDTDETEDVEIRGVDPRGRVAEHGPLAQELSHVVGHALPGRVGLGLNLPLKIPFAVVAGKCSDKVPADAIHWLHGNVVTPEECGGRFDYTVDAFEGFNENSGRHALAAYLDVMLSGLRAGEEWLANQNHLLLPPKPLSGRAVKFGSVPLTVSLKYSPLDVTKDAQGQQVASQNAALPLRRRDPAVEASQGEIFEGTCDLSKLRVDAPDSVFVKWSRDESAEAVPVPAENLRPAESSPQVENVQKADVSHRTESQELPGTSASVQGPKPVLVKVVSRACYGHLVGVDGFLWQAEYGAFDGVRKCLAPSLHAFYVSFDSGKKRGLVQLMPDLSKQGFKPLRPETLFEDVDQRRRLWIAFAKLVTDTLIPLAEAHIIHPDLRPGFNRTPNLLYNDEAGEMRIIDLDSLVSFYSWTGPMKDSRYLTHTPYSSLPDLRTALEFLLYQVAALADAWMNRIREGEANVEEIVAHNDLIAAWSRRDPREPCNGAFILQTIGDLGVRFGVAKDSE
jgi:hypothetical protein